jgi:predicted HTH transcriptional regulator
MTEEEFAQLIAEEHEIRGVEFKPPGLRTDKELRLKVIRAVLGMANLRDGGRIIVGYDEHKSLNDQIGLNEREVESWKDYDALAASINEYANPSVHFNRETQEFRGVIYLIIRVFEFEEIPILCGKDDEIRTIKGRRGTEERKILRRGACYVRSRHKPETSEIPSAEDMRELLELAIDKGVRRFVARAQKVGLIPTFDQAGLESIGEERFKKQLEEGT